MCDVISQCITNNMQIVDVHLVEKLIGASLRHILIECVDLNDVRNKCFVASSVKDIFNNVKAQKIVDFIKETRFYK